MSHERNLQAIIAKLQTAHTHGTVQRCTPAAGIDLPDLSAAGSMEIAQITRERIAGES